MLAACYTGSMNNIYLFCTHFTVIFGALIGAFLAGAQVLQIFTALCAVFASLFVAKKMLLCGFISSGGDLYIVASMTALALGTAVWGQRYARGVFVIGIGLSLCFFLLSAFQLAYVPSADDCMQGAFLLLLGRVPAITLWSLAAHGVAQVTTIFLTSRLRCLGAAGTFLSLVFGQVIDGAIFFGGVFGRAEGWGTIIQMVAVSMMLKMIPLFAGSVLVRLALWSKEQGYVQ